MLKLLRSILFLTTALLTPTQNNLAQAATRTTPLRQPMPARIIAIGDLHGDLKATRNALRLAGAVNSDDHWIGGPLVVVQVGDLIDRGDDDRAVIDWLEALKIEAHQAGGQLITLLGNHEFMNATGDLRYVSQKSMQAFAEFGEGFSPESARALAFRPGGAYAKILANNPIAVIFGDTLFIHAGLSKQFLNYGLECINREAKQFLTGQLTHIPAFADHEDGPVWTRRFSDGPSQQDCDELKHVLGHLKCKRMVVGHTVQFEGIGATCDELCWVVDSGLSFTPNKAQVLEITKDGVKVLKAA